MEWEDIEEKFDVKIPVDEPVFPINIVCDLVHMHYHTLYEIMKEGIVKPAKKQKHKKLFSQRDVKKLKYIQYLIEDRGVNVKGVKVILEIQEE